MSVRAFLFSSAALLLPAPVWAQSAFELDEAVVTSNLIDTAPNRTGATIEVVTSDDLVAAPVAVQDTLERLPGVTAVQTGGFGTESTVSIRGLNEYYIGVTYDGIEVTDVAAPQNQFPFGQLSRPQVGRIEVAKGTQTAIYGSDAIAGALNIQSWRPTREGLSFEASLEAGSRNSYSGALNAGFIDDRTVLAFTASRTTTDGYAARINDPEEDGFQQSFLSFSLERDVTDVVTLGANAFYEDSFLEYDQTEGSPIGTTDGNRRGARVFARVDGERIEHELALSYFRSYRGEDGFGFGAFPFVGEREKLQYIGRTDAGARAELAFGADWTNEKRTVGSGEFAEIDEEENYGLFGEVNYALSPDTDVALSLRQDVYEELDNALTGRVAAIHRFGTGLSLRGTIGTGYRVPSFEERFGFAGDPTFQPEESLGGDIALTQTFENGFVEAAIFRNEIDNLIQFDPDLGFFGEYFQLDGTAVSQGVEISGEVQVGSYLLFGNYTYTDAEVDGDKLVRVPEHDLSVARRHVVGGEACRRVVRPIDLECRVVHQVHPLVLWQPSASVRRSGPAVVVAR